MGFFLECCSGGSSCEMGTPRAGEEILLLVRVVLEEDEDVVIFVEELA